MKRDPLPETKSTASFLRQALTNPAARVYLAISGAGLGLLVITMFLFGSPLAAAILFCTGLMSLVLGYTAMPVFTIFAVAYLLYAPLGVPFETGRFSMISGSYFRIHDVVVIGSLLIHLMALYRLYTLLHIGMPFEATTAYLRKTAKPTTREVKSIVDAELVRFFMRIGLCLFAGQLMWLIVVNIGYDFNKQPPFGITEEEDPISRIRRDYVPPMISSGLNRFLMTATIIFVTVAILRFVFWYWRLWNLNPDEGAMILTDTQWSEQRREFNRQEKWRALAKAKATGQTKPRERSGCLFYIAAALVLMLFGISMTCCLALIR